MIQRGTHAGTFCCDDGYGNVRFNRTYNEKADGGDFDSDAGASFRLLRDLSKSREYDIKKGISKFFSFDPSVNLHESYRRVKSRLRSGETIEGKLQLNGDERALLNTKIPKHQASMDREMLQ